MRTTTKRGMACPQSASNRRGRRCAVGANQGRPNTHPEHRQRTRLDAPDRRLWRCSTTSGRVPEGERPTGTGQATGGAEQLGVCMGRPVNRPVNGRHPQQPRPPHWPISESDLGGAITTPACCSKHRFAGLPARYSSQNVLIWRPRHPLPERRPTSADRRWRKIADGVRCRVPRTELERRTPASVAMLPFGPMATDEELHAGDEKAQRRAARKMIAAYHDEQLRLLLNHIRDGFAKFDSGEIDVFDLDEIIGHYKRSAVKLQVFRSAGAKAASMACLRTSR
jgi:hypothetical protein